MKAISIENIDGPVEEKFTDLIKEPSIIGIREGSLYLLRMLFV